MKWTPNAVTAFVAVDRGGGSVILPGTNGSEFADQDFSSFVAIGRVKQNLGLSFSGLLVTDREIHGGGYNRVTGPDFQWRPTSKDALTGQLLFSFNELPDRPDLTPSWNGPKLSGYGADTWYSHSTATWDFTTEYKDFADGFRTDEPRIGRTGPDAPRAMARLTMDKTQMTWPVWVRTPIHPLLFQRRFLPRRSQVVSTTCLLVPIASERQAPPCRKSPAGRVACSWMLPLGLCTTHTHPILSLRLRRTTSSEGVKPAKVAV